MSDIAITLQDGSPIQLSLTTPVSGAQVTSSVTPKALGTATIGTEATAARADHVHPVAGVVALAIALG